MARKSRPLEERFAEKTIPAPGGCIEWVAGKTSFGYGVIWTGERLEMAHRVALRIWRGVEVGEGMHTDHLCRNPSCVNPDHLEITTPRTNILRGIGIAAQNAVKTSCKQGHEFTAENTIWRSDGKRACRECKKNIDKHYRRSRGQKERVSLIQVGIGKKTCSRCDLVFDETSFYSAGKGRRRAMCKKCYKERW